jgi:hypothetical protein
MVAIAPPLPECTTPPVALPSSGASTGRAAIVARDVRLGKNEPCPRHRDDPRPLRDVSATFGGRGGLDAQTRTILQEELLRLWATLGTTVLYITHSIEQAVLLGDRIAIMTARPGRVKHVFAVPVGRPRGIEARAAPDFGALLERVWAELPDEVLRAADDEARPPHPARAVPAALVLRAAPSGDALPVATAR